MAHFVSLQRNPPSPEDDIDVLFADAAGNARAGLWGFMDGSTACTVKITGPGSATPGMKYGNTTQVWTFTGLTAASRIQGFSGTRPFTGVLEVHIGAAGASLGEQNKALLAGSDPDERARVAGAFVPAVPLEKAIGDYHYAPKMGTVRGLAVHITAGGGAADSLKKTFEDRGASTHFVIDRAGSIVQYVAASIRAQAQGPGNGHFLSVEMVGVGAASGACQTMTGPQLTTLRGLWGWVRERHSGVPNKLARAFAGRKALGTELAEVYVKLAHALGSSPVGSGVSDSIAACIDSYGLSCHYWLDTAVKPCPGVGIMGQLPQVLGQPDRVAVAGDGKYILA